MGMGWRSQHELIMCGTRENAMWSKHMDAQGNVFTLKRDPNLEHPTMKPVALPDTVLETTPFAAWSRHRWCRPEIGDGP